MFRRTKALIVLAAALLTAVCGQSARATAYAVETRNTNGIVNRSLSVDPTGLKEGFSAVLYDNSNGLPTSEANAIAETEDGFIWIGSYAGLIRYDGNTFERMDSTGGITSIKCLYVDSEDRLWIGTNDNGVALMDRGDFRIWGKLEGMSSAHTRAITQDLDGTVYIGTNKGIMMIDKDFNLSSIDDPQVAEADMRVLQTANDGTVYGTTDSGDLIVIRDGKLVDFISTEESPLNGAGVILPDPFTPGRLYQEAPDFGLYYVDLNEGFEVLDKIDIDPLRYLMTMEYIDGKIWVCAGNGVGVLENGRFRLLDNLPMSNNVGHVMTDYLGNLWFTSTRQGVMKVVPNQFSDLFGRYGIPETVVNSTSMYEGKLFIATDTGLIVLGENGTEEGVPVKHSVSASGEDLGVTELISYLTDIRIRSVIRDSKDRLWLSTWRGPGLLCYDHGELTVFSVDDGLQTNNIRAVCECEDGTILVALTGGVAVIKDGRVAATYGKDDGIGNVESLTVEEGTNGDIILGSNGGGIYIIDSSGVKKTINVEEGLSSDIVMRLKHDLDHNVTWIVSSNTIAYMTPDYQVTTIKRFPYPNNFDLYETSVGDMWILSSNGIYVVPADELLANGEISPVFFSNASGLPVITTANSYSDLTPEGDLYIAGSTGVCKVNIEQPFEDVNDLKAAVPFAVADGEVFYPDEDGILTIPSTTHKLTVQGFVYNYSLSDPLVSYRLEGFDNKDTTVNRSDLQPVDYTNLRGGTYHFVMQIKDSLGRGNKVVSATIVKEQAFYEMTWFIVLLGVLVLVGLAIGLRAYVAWRMRKLEKKQQEAREQFEQTAEALATAIDAKDRYTNGHSRRVAQYSEKIARAAGRSEEECEKIYFAALLHDVGKIGVPIEILSKKGRLTEEEFEHIKQHPVAGGEILSKIKNSPWLSVGARYHHERINGKGYPEGLKGNDIPEIARIIAVADAYDAMTSNRSYRSAIPQHIVREELVKGIGTQFDPEFARIMIHMIDLDTEYRMQESESGANISRTTDLRCDELYHDCTEGIAVSENMSKIRLCSQPDDGQPKEASLPSLIVFDSLDGKVHPGEEDNRNVLYYEYARIRFDGKTTERNIRKSKVTVLENETNIGSAMDGEPENGQRYIVEAVRYRDHLQVSISDEDRTIRAVIALPSIARMAYIAIGGEKCYIHNIFVEKSETKTDPGAIPRIAEEISYIKDCPEGDVPNIQIDNWCDKATEGIRIENGLTLTFHTMSLPTARLIWHCPYIVMFTSADGRVKGENYGEYLQIRMNGEHWSSDESVENDVRIEQKPGFEGWDAWKEKNKQGFDCIVKVRRDKNSVIMETENLGISINSVTTVHDSSKEVFIAITGDQCAITDIHISRGD